MAIELRSGLAWKSTNDGTETHDFGVADERGRAMGASVTRITRVVVQRDDLTPWDIDQAEKGYAAGDVRFSFYPHATRNGRLYGASNHATDFETVAERDAAIEKYLAGAKKRAAGRQARAAKR